MFAFINQGTLRQGHRRLIHVSCRCLLPASLPACASPFMGKGRHSRNFFISVFLLRPCFVSAGLDVRGRSSKQWSFLLDCRHRINIFRPNEEKHFTFAYDHIKGRERDRERDREREIIRERERETERERQRERERERKREREKEGEGEGSQSQSYTPNHWAALMYDEAFMHSRRGVAVGWRGINQNASTRHNF
jgi:hypothetical protein